MACLQVPTMEEIARVMGEVRGRSSVGAEFLSEEFQAQRVSNPPVASQGWAGAGRLDVDLEVLGKEVREYGVEVGTLRGYSEREREALVQGFDG
jgi:hypothetical protein